MQIRWDKMELVLYYIVESRNLLISFLILTFVLGIIVYSLIKKFKQNKKMKVVIYGLFLKFTNVDILKLSIIVVKTFLVFYAIMVTNELVMWLCIAMITILTIIYIICEFKRVIYEVIYTSIQALVIYLIYLINSYMMEVEYLNVVMGVKVCLIVFEVILSIYLMFRNINIISEERVTKNFKKESKKIAKGTN